MAGRKTLYGWLTNRYLLIIRNEENFAEKRTIKFNYARILLILMGSVIVSLIISTYLVSVILRQWLDPRHSQNIADRKLIELTIKLDSLEVEMSRSDLYMDNIQRVLTGDDSNDSIGAGQSVQKSSTTDISLSKDLIEVDSQFRAENEDMSLPAATSLIKFKSDELNGMFLFKPIEGIVTNKYRPASDHYGIDVVAKENEPVKSVLDGVVIFSSWTLEYGYVIGIQHSWGGLVSIYKHNSELLKNVGNFVTSGEIISIIGNTGELTTGSHLHLELWREGNALNPEDFISF